MIVNINSIHSKYIRIFLNEYGITFMLNRSIQSIELINLRIRPMFTDCVAKSFDQLK